MEFEKDKETYFIRLDRGDDLMSSLKEFAMKEKLSSGSLSGIGALEEVELGFYHLKDQVYQRKTFSHEYELISMTGNLSILEEEPFFHIHCVLGDDQYKAFGGHVFNAKVAVTCEVVFQKMNISMKRKMNCEIGLNLIQFK